MNLQIIYFSQKKCDGIWDWFGKDWSWILIRTTVVWLRILYSIPQKCDNQISPGFCKKKSKYSRRDQFKARLVKNFDTIRKADKIERACCMWGSRGSRVRESTFPPTTSFNHSNKDFKLSKYELVTFSNAIILFVKVVRLKLMVFPFGLAC